MTTETVKLSLLSAAGTCPLLSNKVLDTIDLSNEKEEEIFECIDLDEDDELNLRLSDEDDTDQGASTKLVNGQRASFRLKQDDLEENSLDAVNENQPGLEEDHLIKLEEESEFVDQESISDQESNMGREIPPLMQNGPRYWSNNYHNSQRWSSPDHRNDRPRTNFKNKGQKDWYNHKYSDKNNRNYNNYNEPNGRVRNRSSYDNSNYNNSNNRRHQHNSLSPPRTPKENNNLRRSRTDNTEQMESQNLPSNTDFEVKSLEEIKSEKKNAEAELKKLSDNKSEVKDEECTEKIIDDCGNESLESKDEKEPTKEEEDKLLAEDDDNEVETSSIPEKEEETTKESESTETVEIVNQKENKETITDDEDCKEIEEDNSVSNKDEIKEIEVENMNESKKLIDIEERIQESDELRESETLEESKLIEESKDLEESNNSEKNEQEVIQENEELKMNVDVQEKNTVLDPAQESIKTEELVIDNEPENSDKVENLKTVTVEDDENEKVETKESENECQAIKVDKESSVETQNDENTEITISNVESINQIDQNESDDNDMEVVYDISEKAEAELLEEINTDSKEITEIKEDPLLEKIKQDELSEKEKSSKEVEEVEEVMEIDEVVSVEEKVENVENEEPKDALSSLVEEIFTDEDKSSGSITKSTDQSNGLKVDVAENQLEQSTTIDLVDEVSIDINEESIDASEDVSSKKIENSSEVDKAIEDVDSQVKKVEAANEQLNEQVQANLKKKKRKKRDTFWPTETMSEEILESGRAKRRSAIAATDNIRKEILDIQRVESDDESDKVPYKKNSSDNHVPRPLSPPTFKRTIEELEEIACEVVQKKMKPTIEEEVETISVPESDPVRLEETPSPVEVEVKSDEKKEVVSPVYDNTREMSEAVRKISQRDVRTSLKKLSKQELEALLIQKCVECMTNKSEIGKLREQARAANRNLESTRTRCQLLAKQVEGFEMVLKKIAHDKSTNGDKYIQPIKINRSVGLQVNFVTPESGIQNLRSLTTSKVMGTNNSPLSVATPSILTSALITNPIRAPAPLPQTLTSPQVLAPPPTLAPAPSPRKGIRTRGPVRRADQAYPQNRNAAPLPPVPGLVLHDPTKRMGNVPNQNNVSPMPISAQTQMPGQKQNLVSTNLQNTPTKTTNVSIHKPSPAKTISSDFIDLTDEEDKVKVTPGTQPMNVQTPAIINDMQNKARFQRVIQTTPISLPSNVTLASPVRLVQPGQAPQVGSTIMNNVTAGGRPIAYIMQNGVSKQFVLASNPSPIRQVNPLGPRSMAGGTINYRPGIATLPGQTLRLLSPPANTLMLRHPAPLPVDTSPVDSNPSWKKVPPAPSLNIKKDESGIILSWRMVPGDRYAEVASYQLYAYTEMTGSMPSTAFWKKVGDVRALRLPMAVTLTQFSEGNNYYFAVRAVDAHSRLGPYSRIVNISL